MSVTYHIRGGGDHTVGISDETAEVTFNSVWLGDEVDCDRIRREVLSAAFASLFDGRVIITRLDEEPPT